MVEGFAPWEELSWPGSIIAVGEAELEVLRPIARCSAPSVNPTTGEQDVNVLGLLAGSFGHECMGVYARVRRSGRIASGDKVVVGSQRNHMIVADALASKGALSLPSWIRHATICEVSPCGEDTAHILIEDDGSAFGAEIKALAGQHLRVHLPGPEWRCYTITETSENGLFRITVKLPEGVVSNWLHKAQPGDRIMLTGPFGNFVYPEASPKSLVILTAGIGITPALSFLKQAALETNPPKVLLLNVSRAGPEMRLWDEIEAIGALIPSMVTMRYVTGDTDGSAPSVIGGRPDFKKIDWNPSLRPIVIFVAPPSLSPTLAKRCKKPACPTTEYSMRPLFRPRRTQVYS